MKKRLHQVALLLFLPACASIQAPQGGPPDRLPPELKRWHTRQDRRGGQHYILRWNEFLDPTGEALPTIAWLNPTPTDSLPPFWKRIRGKRLFLIIPASHAGAILWLGPAVRDFTEKNPLSPRPLIPDSQAHLLRISPPSDAKHPAWLLIRRPEGYYRFLAQGDSFYLAHLPDTLAEAFGFEDINGNTLWDGAREALWLPVTPQKSLLSTAWSRALLDTLPPRPVQVLPRGTRTLLRFGEPIRAEGNYRPLAENVLLALDSSLTLYDSLGYAFTWQKLRADPADTVQPHPASLLFWSWGLNSQTPWIYLSTPDTAVRPDTFLHLRIGQTEGLLPLCQEGGYLIIAPREEYEEAMLIGASSPPPQLPLRKVPVLLRPDSAESLYTFRIYPPPVLNNGAPFQAAAGDTLWLIPGSYTLTRADTPPPRVILEGRWPRFEGQPSPTYLLSVRPGDSLQVFQISLAKP